MNMMTQPPRASREPESPRMDTFDARDLVRDGVQCRILLDGQAYYLRITRAGKLILTK